MKLEQWAQAKWDGTTPCSPHCRHRTKMLFAYATATEPKIIHDPVQSLWCQVSLQ